MEEIVKIFSCIDTRPQRNLGRRFSQIDRIERFAFGRIGREGREGTQRSTACLDGSGMSDEPQAGTRLCLVRGEGEKYTLAVTLGRREEFNSLREKKIFGYRSTQNGWIERFAFVGTGSGC